jgi:aldehyde:ferredoxin oxidoreductase
MYKDSGFGKIIDIDLTKQRIDTREFTAEMALETLGGFGYNMHLLYTNLEEGTDPLGPENIMVVSLGLLTGSAAPSSSRVHINCLPDHPRRCGGPGVPGHR